MSDMEEVCRVCLNKFTEPPLCAMEPLLVDMINECFHLKLKDDDIQPSNICELCISDVRAAIRFKRNYEQNIKLKESRLNDFIDSLEAENWDLICDFVKKEPEDISDVDAIREFEPQNKENINSKGENTDGKIAKKPKTKKTYVCNFCDKVFTKKRFLTIHLRVHTGERPFNCPHCLKTFTQASSRNTHLRVHTGERKFKCPYCPKDFTRRHNLLSHVANHVPPEQTK